MPTLSQQDFLGCLESEAFLDADRALARFISDKCDSGNLWLPLAAALTMRWARMGHTYFDVLDPEGLAKQLLPFGLAWPDQIQWKEILNNRKFVGTPHSPNAPLIFEAPNCLYLNRYYVHEVELAEKILSLALSSGSLSAHNASISVHSKSLDSLHPTQADAINAALADRFHIITGGPGTGKTTIALHYLKELLETNALGERPRIAAVAPTGKAAARLQESLSSGIDRLDTDTFTKESLEAIECQTIHRLLGYLPFKTEFRRNRRNPISVDAIVIDEASMIDLPLMNRLFQAIPQTCRILMLGDSDQLASVEVGTTFADFLAAASNESSPLNRCVSRLTQSYRFSADSSIRRICDSSRDGDQATIATLLENEQEDFAFFLTSIEQSGNLEKAYAEILERHKRIIDSCTREEALEELNRFTILSPMRATPLGTQFINAEIYRRITGQRPAAIDQVYHGAPIMIVENDYDQELFNGDLGLAWQPNPAESAQALFLRDGLTKTFPLSVVSRYEIANAMTIHKSQGSEFETVAVVFDHTEPRFLTRELLYTAMSRARKRLMLFGRKTAIQESIHNRVSRATGLAERLAVRR